MRARRWSDLGSSAVADLASVAGPSGTRSAARGEVAHSRALPRHQGRWAVAHRHRPCRPPRRPGARRQL